MGHPGCILCQHGPYDLTAALVWEMRGKTCLVHRSADYLALRAVFEAARDLLAGIDPFKVDDAEARLLVVVDRLDALDKEEA